MTEQFIEIISGLYVNINMLEKVVRNVKGGYFIRLTSKERFPITTEKALSLIALGIPHE